MATPSRWVGAFAGVGLVLAGAIGHVNIALADPPSLVLQLDTTECKPRCMPRSVVRHPAAPLQARTVWVNDSQSADARVVLKPKSIEWWVGTEQSPRFILTADPRLHPADGGLQEQWAAALNRVFLARSLLYTAFVNAQSAVTVSAERSSSTEVLLRVQNTGKQTRNLEAFFIDRTYGLQRRSLPQMTEGEAQELIWSVNDTTDPAYVVLRVSADDGPHYSATKLFLPDSAAQ